MLLGEATTVEIFSWQKLRHSSTLKVEEPDKCQQMFGCYGNASLLYCCHEMESENAVS